MRKSKSSKKDNGVQQGFCDQKRRDVLKKAAYIPPTLVTLGTLAPLNSNAGLGSSENPPCPPGQQPGPGGSCG